MVASSFCRAGLPRVFEQTRQVKCLYVVAESLVRLGPAPVATAAARSTSFAPSLTFRPSLNSLAHCFAESSFGTAHLPASNMFSSGPALGLNWPAHVQSLHLMPAPVSWLGSCRWNSGSPLGPFLYLNSGLPAAHLDSGVRCLPSVEEASPEPRA